MWIGVISLFPEMFRAITNYGIIGRAIKNGLLNIQSWNPRDFSYDRHRTVDSRPYGGGSGMVMMVQPLRDAIRTAKNVAGLDVKVIYLSPQGRKLDQKGVNELAKNKKLIFICGRYKGIDERVIKVEVNEEWSVGDYILSGGEIPAMILIDSIARVTPGVLGKESLLTGDSFTNGLLDFPNYTRPRVLDDLKVPTVLLSGNHSEIRRWRLMQSLGRTWIKRPDLLRKYILTEEQVKLLNEFKNEYLYQRRIYNK